METSNQVNQFTVFDNSLIQDKTEYNKYITWIAKYKNVNKRVQQPYIFTCERFGACREEYKLLDLKQIRDKIKKGKCLYEIVYMCRYVKPYLDIDVKDMEVDEVKQIYKYFVDKLKEKGITYNIGGYTNIKGLLADCVEYKEKATKQLSLHITGLSHYVEHDKVLAYWLDFVGIDTKYIKSKVFDISVYKDYTKQQKFRMAFCHKEPSDKINISNMFVIGEDRIRSYTVDEDDERFTSFLITWINEDMEYMDLSNSLTNQQYRDKINGKHNKIISSNNVNADGNINNAKEDVNYGEYVYNPSTPLLTEEQLTRLLNLFEPDYNDSFGSVLSPLANSPYPLYLLLRVVDNWYNQRPRQNPKNAINYIKAYYKYNPTDMWFYTIINNYYEPKKIDNNEWTTEDEILYNKLAFKANKILSKKQRQQKEDIINKYNEARDNFKNNMSEEDKKKYKTRKEFIKEFTDIKRIISPYNNKGNYYNMLYLDYEQNCYILNEYNLLKQIPQEKFDKNIQKYKLNPNKITVIKSISEFNFMRKYNGVYLSNEYDKHIEESLNIFKSGFELEEDYIYYMRWLSAKFNDPMRNLPRNIVCLEGACSFKTTFISSFMDFIKITNVDYQTDTLNTFNEWVDSSIIIIDEIPSADKEVSRVQNTLKRLTSTKYVKINRKFEHENMIENHANYIINSNYPDCGGLFNNQVQNEMFRRFRIIKKKTIDEPYATTLYNYLSDKHLLYNLYYYIKMNFKPLTDTECKYISDADVKYMEYVKNKEDNKHVLQRYIIDECVDNKNRLRLNYLVNCLKARDYKTSMATEKTILLQRKICDISDGHLIIVNMDKFVDMYLNDEFEENDQQPPI